MSSVSTNPIFPQTPKTDCCVLMNANNVYYGDTEWSSIEELIQAGSNGSIITSISAISNGTIDNSVIVQLFIQPSGTGPVYQLDSALLSTVGSNGGNPISFFRYSDDRPLRLGSNDMLYAGISIAAPPTVTLTAQCWDY